MSGASWRQANLQGANFTQANLIQSPFEGVNLKNATVGGIILVDQEFQRWYKPPHLSVESIENRKSSSPRIYP
ncbi:MULTISPECIES: pentapeptide repeat-containing protein [unclassified Microcoleus]|uniref:pentapeptide repeat-containing protein n=1 Tax=unclassified Microcoleus TaxID=2642155 RepID=UPI004040C37C